MKNVSIYCLTLDPSHEEIIHKLSLIPVGLGEKKFSKNCFTDKTANSINEKNPFYGEYTFHYWLWKNHLHKIQTPWVGFCQYRKFFVKKDVFNTNLKLEQLQDLLIYEVNENDKSFDCILGEKFSVKNYKISKILKHHFFEFISRPGILLNKSKRNIKFHFDLFHGKGNLDKAINFLDDANKELFKNYVNSETSFNPHNMFFCKTNILKNYYDVVFPWLEKCESIFGFNDTKNYGLKRIYGFLAERFLSFWFNNNCKVKELPIIGKDLSDYKYF